MAGASPLCRPPRDADRSGWRGRGTRFPLVETGIGIPASGAGQRDHIDVRSPRITINGD